ncbi:MAG: NADPH-dependent FMN reductase [Micavibrio sp.]
MFSVAVVVGSLRKESNNLKLARALEKLGAGKMKFSFLSIGDLPLFNQDLEANRPDSVLKLKKDIESADAVLFVTAEYNRSIPGVLKNAIDWASRPYGQSSWAGKPAAICGASPGAIGTALAQQHLHAITGGYLDMNVMGQPEVYLAFKDGMIDADGNISNDDIKKFLQGFVDRFIAFVGEVSSAKAKAA